MWEQPGLIFWGTVLTLLLSPDLVWAELGPGLEQDTRERPVSWYLCRDRQLGEEAVPVGFLKEHIMSFIVVNLNRRHIKFIFDVITNGLKVMKNLMMCKHS